METVTQKRYTAEFKAQAVGLVGTGKPVKDVARDLGISEGVLYEWVRKAGPQPSAGWLYLAVVIDLGSRRIPGWSLQAHLRADLVLDALQQALQARPVEQTIFHSDRGSQYASAAFRQALAQGRPAPKHVLPGQPL